MTPEQALVVGVVVFGIMAGIALFNTVRSLRRAARWKRPRRQRRPAPSAEAAYAIAECVVREVAAAEPDLVKQAREKGEVGSDLDQKLEKARDYFSQRVDPRHRHVFAVAVDAIVLCRGSRENLPGRGS